MTRVAVVAVVVLALLVAPLAAGAQEPTRMRRVGAVMGYPECDLGLTIPPSVLARADEVIQ